MKNYLKLIISVSIPLLIGFAGSFFTSSSVSTWYTTLNKPTFNPPGWIFGPVWTLLYIIIWVSFYFVWKVDFKKKNKQAVGIYSLQLFLNLIWSFLFFWLQNSFASLIEIIILWCAILANMIVFYRIEKMAGLLLLPYLLWVSFATILNYSILVLNF